MLKIETVKKQVVLCFEDGSRMTGSFFVSVAAEDHSGTELISELLSRDRNYLPFEVSETGEIVLLRKENIMMASIEGDEESDNFLPGYKQVRVDILLLNGKVLSGKVSFALPETHSRLSDFLNSRDAFFRLEMDGKNHLVQNRFVKLITAQKPE
ncbi:MAG TPA: hypothetical protein PK090_07600 [Smithellaceae bacterium]|nr:hypothetical protein [Smithellaceae bacterium]